MSWKNCKVVILPTEKASNIFTTNDFIEGTSNLRLGYSVKPVVENLLHQLHPQYLYILSDEEIKSVDYCYNTKRKTIESGRFMKSTSEYIFCKKIIASTDKFLELPEPSKSFIEVFVKAYNDDGKFPITEVMVEYDENGYIDILKVDENNTITIRKIKSEYDRQDINTMLEAFAFDCFNEAKKLSVWTDDYPITFKNKWIEENLH